MREIFVSDLVANVLGPRNGAEETMEHNPLSEYITGILAPIWHGGDSQASVDDQSEIPSTVEGGSDNPDDHYEQTVDVSSLLSPALDPKNVPSSMGMTFNIKSDGDPRINVCVTWSRYFETGNPRVWQRSGRSHVREVKLDVEKQRFNIDPAGRITDGDAELSLHVFSKKREEFMHVTLLVVNRIKPDEGSPKTVHHLFQPQIRIVCGKGTKLLPQGSHYKPDMMSMQYENRPVYARGLLTSVVWAEVDPEIPSGEMSDSDASELPGFFWTDGRLLEDSIRQIFSKADLRTDYIPMYSVPAPNLEGKLGEGSGPNLDASFLAECYEPEVLRNHLETLADGYDEWIEELESRDMPSKYDKVAKEILGWCKTAHSRMLEGIEKLCTDDDARMAFCFANKAIAVQSKWRQNKDFTYRPFQIAFVLASIESILNPESKHRDVCDLLWVPTGTGKTEAYLVIVAMVLAYRRLKCVMRDGRERTGGGTAVISRYTLRLLTIQQFRRSLYIITACEFLRVYNFGTDKKVGWRPESCNITDDIIWGSTPFSVGLWVGNSVTPNRLIGFSTRGMSDAGAVDMLSSGTQSGGEPAQILNCPACDHILAVPSFGIPPGDTVIHFVFSSDTDKFGDLLDSVKSNDFAEFTVHDINVTPNPARGFHTMTVRFSAERSLKSRDIDGLWNTIKSVFAKGGIQIRVGSSRASRPGYFLRRWIKSNRNSEDYDFDIFCPNPECPLRCGWFGGMPMGKVHGRQPDPMANDDSVGGIRLPDGNHLVDVHEPFQTERFIADRMPIPALTVDEQVYSTLPSMVVGTVDKFARLPFEPRTASLFGNVDYYHCVRGFGRINHKGLPSPRGTADVPFHRTEMRRAPPTLIIQDELHLIEGPLGSLVGMYETAVDFLSQRARVGPKYIASTATIRRAKDHVQSLFATRDVMVFPPPGLSADDRFFVKENERHALSDSEPGRLYVGICAPGKGALTPIVRIWARLAQTAHERRELHGIDPFWTITGYFNAVRELAGARALYRQDIPEWIHHMAANNPRYIPDDRSLELSSRTPSDSLPSILETLNSEYPDAQDGLFTTSMFGTGVDVSRLGLMIVNGQPKTTSSYIQSTGRVGRKSGALVVTFFRASRPRDLSHYEFFVRHHRQMHRFVEPPTIFPFASGVQERALGPVGVAILRNMHARGSEWASDGSAGRMASLSNRQEVADLPRIFEERAASQPDKRMPVEGSVRDAVSSSIDRWRNIAENYRESLKYVEYSDTKYHEVLGDAQHMHAGKSVVYRNAPTSLREVEEETGFQT